MTIFDVDLKTLLRLYRHKNPLHVIFYLERAEDLGAGGSAGEADVEVGAEGAVLSVDVLHAEILAVGLRLPFVDLVETVLCSTRMREA